VADTLFFGGGTPSLMKPHHIEKIFNTLHKYIEFTSDAEMTMECNPGTIDLKFMGVYKSLGINRISFGVQSFIEKDLKFLERIHSTEDAQKAVEIARTVGFENVSVDLMFALPGQTADDWRYNLECAVKLDTNHISAYSLIYEPGTPLYNDFINGKVAPQDEDSDTELYSITDSVLTKTGFSQYEVSNYAKNGYKCKHNLKYWDGGDYIGLGPSAHGYIDGQRYWNYRSNEKYFELLSKNELPVEGYENLTLEQKIFESIYLGLRAEGIDNNSFKSKFGIDILDLNKELIEKLQLSNHLIKTENGIKLTNSGYFIGDNITLEFSKFLNN
jgi:oxygen-independent coproporphyrinogen-3 oxidase